METLTVANKNGRKFRVQIVRKGEKYGLNKCLTHDGEMPLVEFYDLTYPEKFGAEGQFVSRYRLDTLKEHDRHCGLDLQGNVPEWKIDGYAMDEVMAWLPSNPVEDRRCRALAAALKKMTDEGKFKGREVSWEIVELKSDYKLAYMKDHKTGERLTDNLELPW